MELTQARLKDLLHYDPETGVFTRRVKVSNTKTGTCAGSTKGERYTRIMIDYRMYRAHRLAWLYMTGMWPKGHIDHLDGDPANNRFANLREATRSQNLSNRPKQRNNTSGYKGVVWHPGTQKWRAQIGRGRKSGHIGLFETPEEAYAAYVAEAEIAHGEFAKVS